MARLVYFLFSLLFVYGGASSVNSINKELVEHLLQNACAGQIPISKPEDKVTVSLFASVQSIDQLDRETGQAHLSLLVTKSWNTGITWNPEDFHGRDYGLLRQSQIWTPYLRMRNAVMDTFNLAPHNVVIMNDGTAYQDEHYLVTVACDLSKDSCHVDFSSPAFPNSRLALQTPDNSKHNFNDYLNRWANKGGRYQAQDVQFKKSSYPTPGYNTEIDVITFNFHIKDTLAHVARGPSQFVLKWD